MGSNFSQRKRLGEVMQQPLGHYHGWRLEIACPSCRDKKAVSIEQLLFRYAGQHPVQSVVNRLRCSTCRKPPSFVRLVGPSDGRSGKPAQEVMLVGPGAY